MGANRLAIIRRLVLPWCSSSMPAESATEMSADHPSLSSTFLSSVQRMDADGWTRLVHVFGPIVYRWCRSAGVPPQDSTDVVQEIFVAVARGIPQFERQKESGSFRSWLATITRNQIRDYFRKQSRAPAATGGSDAMRDLNELPDELDSTICAESIKTTVTQRVMATVEAEFEPKTWKAFWMTTVEGLSAGEVAAVIEISAASVYQAKSRVLRRLRQRLAEMES